jgi:iron complex transport system substrate-binding protein
VITLAPSVTEIAFAVGLGPKVVGVTKFCRYPPEVEKLPRVAGFSDMNIEAIVRLRPDLVILPADKAENRRELTRLGLSVLSVDTRTLEGLIKALEDLGKATGRESEAQKVVDAINEAVSEAGRRAEGKPKPKVMFSVMHSYAGLGYISELTIAGRDGFFDHLIEICGGENAYPGKLPFPSVSREAVFRMNPDVIIDLMRSYSEAEDSMESWNTMTSVSAVQKGRVYMFTEESDTVPGPRAWKTIKKVSMVLHPDPENPPPQILGDVP